MVQEYYGAASRAAQRELGGIFVPRESVLAVDLATVPVVGYNADRIGLVVMNIGTTNITLRTTSPITLGQGILLLGNGAQMTLNWHDDVDIVAQPWYAIGDIAAGSLFVFEMVRAF